jgi:hypothetical protein
MRETIQQVVDEAGELVDLALDDVARPLQALVRRLTHTQTLGGIANRRDGIAQLVRQHRQELVLAAPLHQQLFPQLLLAQIGHDQAIHVVVGVEADTVHRRHDRHHRPVRRPQLDLAAGGSVADLLSQRGEEIVGVPRREREDLRPDDRRALGLHELREVRVAVDDEARRVERHRAVLHLFDHRPVEQVGAAQAVDPLLRRLPDDEGVDLALADRADDVFGLGSLVLFHDGRPLSGYGLA